MTRMSDPRAISEDRGLKAVITSYTVEAIEVFVPELHIVRGKPVATTVLQQESALPDLAKPSRFLDVALLASWVDGSQAVILFIEHWSQARKVNRERQSIHTDALTLTADPNTSTAYTNSGLLHVQGNGQSEV